MKIKIRPRVRIPNIAKESSHAHNSEHLIEKAISNLSEAVKIERCEVCKTWIENAKNVVEDKFDKLKYSQGIYNIMKERKLKTHLFRNPGNIDKTDILEYLDYDVFKKENVAPEAKEALEEILTECDTKYKSPWIFIKCIQDKWSKEESKIKVTVNKKVETIERPYKGEAYNVIKNIRGMEHIKFDDFGGHDFEFPGACDEGKCEFMPSGLDTTYCLSGKEAVQKLKDITEQYTSERSTIPEHVPEIHTLINRFLKFVRGM